MTHSDERISQTLSQLYATQPARYAAERLFSSWEEMAEFFVSVFANSTASLAVALDVSRGTLAAVYDVEGAPVPTMDVLARATASGGVSEGYERLALVFRALTFQSPPALPTMLPSKVRSLLEELRFNSTDSLTVFDSYDITSRNDQTVVRLMLTEYFMPLDYVRDIGAMRGLRAEDARALYSLGVPAGYAVEASRSKYLSGAGLKPPTTASFGSVYGRLHAALGNTMNTMPVAWHVAGLYLEGVPASYAAAGTGRGVADIVGLWEAAVPEGYVRDAGAAIPAAVVLRGHRDGITAEYLREVMA